VPEAIKTGKKLSGKHETEMGVFRGGWKRLDEKAGIEWGRELGRGRGATRRVRKQKTDNTHEGLLRVFSQRSAKKRKL